MKKFATHFLNGKLVEEKELFVSARDLGFARGFAVFDFLITYNNQRPFMLKNHINRLFDSAKLIGLSMPWSKKQVEQWVVKTLDANKNGKEKAIKIIVSGGASNSLLPAGKPTIVITVDNRNPFPAEYYEKGVGITTVKHSRHIPEAKTNNYIEAVKQMQVAKKFKAVEAVYYDDKQVFEGASSNVFALIGGKLITPKTNVLQGVTRGVLLKILKMNIPVEEKDFTLAQLMKAKEVFLTASNKEVMPVIKINGKSVGSGKVGEITKEAMKQFKNFTLSNKW